MKHILLGTSALIGAFAFASVASAATPKVTLGGSIDWQAGIAEDDQDDVRAGLPGAEQRPHAFFNDTEIVVNVDGKSDSGLGYGAEIVLEADVTDDFDAEGTNASRTYIYLSGNWGRVELGSNVGVQSTMKVDASNIARATGGIDGDFYRYVNNLGMANYIITPDLPIGYGFATPIATVTAPAGGGAVTSANVPTASTFGSEAQENVNKIVYYTPKFSGFQLGVNYSPNDRDRGQTIDRTDAGATCTGAAGSVCGVDNVFGAALSWEGSWDQVEIALAATGEIGDAESSMYEDLQAWNVGAQVGYMGFSVAGSYGDWSESYRLKTDGADESDYWTVGAAYEHGPYGISVTYIDANYDLGAGAENEFENIVVGADYKLAPGLTPYAEVAFFDFDANGTADDNEGTVFLVGTQLNF